MSEASTATLRVTDGDTVALNLGTQLAVVEDGKCYFIDLSSTGEALSVTPAPSVIYSQKIDSKGEEVGEESPNESIPLRYYSPNTLNDADGQQVYLDDEQARAVANLLEFHNQQNKTTVSSSNNLIISPSLQNIDARMEDQSYERRDVAILPHDGLTDPLAITVAKKAPVRTYGKRGQHNIAVDAVKLCGEDKALYNSSYSKRVTFDSKSEKTPQYILPIRLIASVMNDHLGPRRKRRLFTDAVKVIPPAEFKQQLQDTSDIVQTKVDSAPPTKKAMYYLAYGGVGKFFAYPGRKVPSVPLSKLFFSRLTMTTEQKSGLSIMEELEPLDADLRTPGMKDNIELSPSQSHPLHHHTFSDTVAKRTANSFDSFCKGMSKPPKFEYKRKKCKNLEIATAAGNEKAGQSISIQQKECSEQKQIATHEHPDLKPVINGTDTEVVITGDTENNNTEIVYRLQHDEVAIAKSDPADPSSEIFVVEENLEAGGAPSNFEMLIAAAEHHNNLHTSVDHEPPLHGDDSQGREIKEEEEEEGSKTPVMYCTNENMEELIILGSNGERYRVTASNQGELTLWPEAECDAN